MSDLQSFQILFGEENYKPIAGGMEYRVANVELAMSQARHIITKNKFKLEVITTGNQATYRAFDVKEVSHA